MPTRSDLQQTRTATQRQRDELERRERTAVDLQLVYTTLEERTERAARGADPARQTDRLRGHLDRLVRRHRSGDRPLDYLGRHLAAVSLEAYATAAVRELDLPDLEADGASETLAEFPANGFAATLLEFLQELVSSGDNPTGTAVTVAYEELLEDGDPIELVRGLVAVGVVLDLAHVAVYGRSVDGRPSVGLDTSTVRPMGDLPDEDIEDPGLDGRPHVRELDDLDDQVERVDREGNFAGTRSQLEQRIAQHVAALETADQGLLGEEQPDPLAALDWDAPIAMLPVDLETRFVDDELLVRIYPDQIHVDTHEDQLTEDEYDWGREFWTKLWVAALPDAADRLESDGSLRHPSLFPDEHTREAARSLLEQVRAGELSSGRRERFGEVRERLWAQGVDRFGEHRAAYLVDVLSPAGDRTGEDLARELRTGWSDGDPPVDAAETISFPDVDMRPSTWTRTPRAALLPDRFVAFAYYEADDDAHRETDWQDSQSGYFERRVGSEFVRRVAGSAVREPLATGPSPESVAADGDATAEMGWMTAFEQAERAGMALRIPIPDGLDASADGFTKLLVRGLKTSMDGPASVAALQSQLAGICYTEGLELLNPGTPTNNASDPSARSDARDPAESLDTVLGPPMVGPDSDGAAIADALGLDADLFADVPGAGDTRGQDARAVNSLLWPATIGYFARNLLVSGVGEDADEGDDRSGDDLPPMLGTRPADTVEGPSQLLQWLETYREHFVEHVRAGGPLQTLRAGTHPYGLLPVAPLNVDPGDLRQPEEPPGVPGRDLDDDQFTPTNVPEIGESRFLPTLATQVWALRDTWREWAGDVPSVTEDPGLDDDDLLSMLSMEATASAYRRQFWLLGADSPLADYADAPNLRKRLESVTENALAELGVRETAPRIADLLFLGGSFVSEDLPITDEDVGTYVDTVEDLFMSHWPDVLLRVLDTDPNADEIAFDAGGDLTVDRGLIDAFDPTRDPADYDSESTLLRQLLLFGGLHAAIASRVRLGAIYGNLPEIPAEPTAYGPGDPSVYLRFQDPLPKGSSFATGDSLDDHPALSGTSNFRDAIRVTATSATGSHPPVDPVLREFVDSLRHIENVGPDRLERLTTETLDLASHRLDAWWTSVATRQLRRLRSAGVEDCYVGAYGVVENLTADPGTSAEYLLAPSLDQVTTASILRSGHQSQPAGSAEAAAMAVDCSPEALAEARPLLAAVRAGLDLPELLGYRFERGLRERSGGASGLNLEQYVGDFRELAPGVEGKLDSGDTTDETKRSDVVDGMAIYRRWKAGTLWTDLDVSLDEEEKDAIGGDGPETGPTDSVLNGIHRAMEALQDLLVAEGVHHLAHGRPERAAAALDGLSRAEPPPEPTVLDTPRSETGVTNRLVLAFGDATDDTVPKAWEPSKPARLDESDLPSRESDDATRVGPIQVRQKAEPNLNAWVGKLLPSPDRVGSSGEFLWERDREFAVGQFDTPRKSGPISVEVGFEPDLVLFRAVTGASESGATESTASGWSHGVYRRGTGKYDAVQRSVAASAADGAVDHDYSSRDALRVPFPGPGERIAGSVLETTDTGFEIEFSTVNPPASGPETVRVSYRAVSLTDPSSVRVGTYWVPDSVPSDDPSLDLAGADTPQGDEFDPDHVEFATAFTTDQTGDGTADSLAIGEGDCLQAETDSSPPAQRTVGRSMGPEPDNFRVTARADAALAASTGGSSPTGFTVAVTDIDENEATISLSAPESGSLASDVPILFIAMESPIVDTVGRSVHHQSAVDHVAAPASDGSTRSVQTGFEPGLVEVTVVGGLTDAAGQLPIDAAVDPAGTVTATGAATSAGVQQSLAAGPTGTGNLAARASDGVAALPALGGDGPETGPTVSIESVSGTGFELGISGLGGRDPPLVFYRAWPAAPATREFAAALPGGVGLDDLDLTPLDAVSITQRVEQSGDSQLERHCGYWAFRHRPTDRKPQRPPVPTDATLDLSFGEPADGYPVSVAEYVEVASEIGDLLGEARPADATDVSHPSAGRDPGYLPDTGGSIPGTAARLANRAGGTDPIEGVEGQLETIRRLLAQRHGVLSQEPNVCDRVAAIDDALGRFRRSVPLRAVTSVADRFSPSGPSIWTETLITRIAREIHQELSAVKDHVSPGPRHGRGVALPVSPASDQTVSGVADVDGVTTLNVTVYPYADAVRFDRTTRTVTTDADGSFTATLDFSGHSPGTEFGVVARPASQGPGGRSRSGDLLARTFEEPNPDDWKMVDEPPLSKQTSEWEFDANQGVLRQSSNIYGFEGPPINAPGTIAVTGNRDWADYRLSVALSSGDDDAIGVLFRVQDAENFYRFSMDHEREYHRLVKIVDDEPTLLWEAEADYDVDERHEMTVEVHGEELVGYLDGEQRFAVADDAHSHGAIGLYCRANEAARFHSVRVTPLGGSTRAPVYARDGRVVADKEQTGRPLAEAVASQRYLPTLLWLDRVAPKLDPGAETPAGALQRAVNDTDWGTVTDEQTLMNRTHSLLASGGRAPETFTVADKRAVADLRQLDDLELQRLFDAVRAAIGPAAWTGLTALLDVTGDPGRPDGQSVWRSDPGELAIPIEKHREGEVRARLERLDTYPDRGVDSRFAAYSPPIRRLVEDGVLAEADVVALEDLVADPADVVDALGDVYPDVDRLVADLHDLLHHVEHLPGNWTVSDLRSDVAKLKRSIRAANREPIVEKLTAGDRYVWDIFADHGQEIELAVGRYRSSLRSDPSPDYGEVLRAFGKQIRTHLSDRVLPASAHDDLSTSFRQGALASVRRLLLRASYFGVYGSVPATAAGGSPADQTTLVGQVERVLAAVTERLDAAAAYDPDTDAAEPTVEGQQRRLQALLGDEFVVCPPFAPLNTDELQKTLAADLTDDPYATDTWLQRNGRIRDLPSSFQRVRTYADALSMRTQGDPGLRRTVEPAQLPHVPGQSWLGTDGVMPTGGELALGIEFVTEASDGPIADRPATAGPPMAGLLIDEWVTRVPAESEQIGLGLQYDDSSTRPPQSIVVATPPQWTESEAADPSVPLDLTWTEGTYWTQPLVGQSLVEMMDLIDVRAVDLEAMQSFGHLLPMLCFASNRLTQWDPVETLRDAPSVDFNALNWEVFGND